MPRHDSGQATRFLVAPHAERAACGTGFIAHLSGQATHTVLRDALSTVARLAHRGAMARRVVRSSRRAGRVGGLPSETAARSRYWNG